MYLFGTILILSGIAAALLATISYVLVVRGNLAALTYGRVGTRAALVAVLAVVALLAMLFVNQRYDIQYVYDYSDKNLEFGFRVAAMWAGQPGSFVVWALWGLIAAQFLIRRTRHAEPYVLSVFMLLQAALLFYMLIRNPFIPYMNEAGVAAVPEDGKGLNPTLHNFWMIIHPPVLFIGYALMAVPFAFAIAGLWRRDYDGWARAAMPWTLAAWATLSLALLLGGYWAYETLGWGGYWGWDPVENSALVPWITGTALLHGLLVQRSHGSMRRTNLALALLTYVCVFYATFLTRTGVLSSFSVHSFVEEGLKNIMIGSLLAITLASVAIFVARFRDIPAKPLSDKLLSRDSFFVLLILGLILIATVIGLGTSMPVISAIPGVGHELQTFFGGMFELDDGTMYYPDAEPFTDGRFGLVASFYTATVPPLALILMLLLTVGPLLGWRDTNVRHMLRALRWPAVVAVVAMCATIVLVATSGRQLEPLPLAVVGLGVFAAGTNMVMIIRTLRSGWLRIGGYLAHVGLMVMLAGVVGSTTYATPEERIVVPEGGTISMYGYDFTFNSWRQTLDGRGLLDMTVSRGGDTFQATPQLYFNQKMGATMATPSVRSELFQDVYISPAEYQPSNDRNIAQLGLNEQKMIGDYALTLQGFDVGQMASGVLTDTAEVGAKLMVSYGGQSVEITPKVRVNTKDTNMDTALISLPARLPDGREVNLIAIDASQRQAFVRVEGLGLPVEPAKAVVTVSVKPGVLLVWLGVCIGVLGGLIAMVRRTLEGGSRLGGRALRVPGWLRLGRPADRRPAPGPAGD
ncbi:MAG: cytochrome c biogenesis protein CcsA [Roseiflexaceae bacterium]